MKAYVSIDLEGMPGIASTTMTSPDKTQFSTAVKIMSMVSDFISKKLLEIGFSEVYIADSHGFMTNVDYTSLRDGAYLIQGYPRPFSMLTMLDGSFSAALFIGYHAAAGTVKGFLDHTMSGRVFHEVFLNGVKASEFLINALYAREKGVPVILVAGDSHLKREVETLSQNIVFVEMKRGLSRYAAVYPPLSVVLRELAKGVEEAVDRLKRKLEFKIHLHPPYDLTLRFRESLVADVAEMTGAERLDAYTVRKTFTTAEGMLGFIEVLAYMGLGVEYLKNSIK
jgi:D-amino peptidase